MKSISELLKYTKGTVIKNISTGKESILSGYIGLDPLDEPEPTIYDTHTLTIICFIETDEWAEIIKQN